MPELNANDDFFVEEDEVAGHEPETMVSEDEVPLPQVIVVEEGTPEIAEYIPGSNKQVEPEVEQEEQAAKDTDWEHDQDHSKFLGHFDTKVKHIPRHSGNTVLGCERAIAFLKSLLNELSKALRSDLDGKIEEQAAEDRYRETQSMVSRLEQQIKKLKGSGKTAEMDVRLVSEGHCDKCQSTAPMWHDTASERVVCLHCEAANESAGLEKTANTPRINVYVSPFERAVVGIMVNSAVSAGKNIEETYDMLKNKYNFTPREELAIQQLVADYGYPVFKDRARLNESSDPSSGSGVDWQTNYYA